MPSLDEIRCVFEDGLAYKAKTDENKDRHLRELDKYIRARDAKNAADLAAQCTA